jgi:hypothetical protein
MIIKQIDMVAISKMFTQSVIRSSGLIERPFPFYILAAT